MGLKQRIKHVEKALSRVGPRKCAIIWPGESIPEPPDPNTFYLIWDLPTPDLEESSSAPEEDIGNQAAKQK